MSETPEESLLDQSQGPWKLLRAMEIADERNPADKTLPGWLPDWLFEAQLAQAEARPLRSLGLIEKHAFRENEPEVRREARQLAQDIAASTSLESATKARAERAGAQLLDLPSSLEPPINAPTFATTREPAHSRPSETRMLQRRRDRVAVSVPEWLTEAQRAARSGDPSRALQLIENYAFRRETPATAKRSAYTLAEQIGRNFLVRDRAQNSATRLEQWRTYEPPDPARVALAEANAKTARLKAEAADAAAAAIRVEHFIALGLPQRRAEALAPLTPGPYDVAFHGVKRGYASSAIRRTLIALGYARADTALVLERVVHIAPEVVAFSLHQSAAVKIKVELENAGAKVRIR